MRKSPVDYKTPVDYNIMDRIYIGRPRWDYIKYVIKYKIIYNLSWEWKRAVCVKNYPKVFQPICSKDVYQYTNLSFPNTDQSD